MIVTLQLDLDRGKFLLSQAFEEDENENFDEAVKLYSDAVEFFLTQVGARRDQTVVFVLWGRGLEIVETLEF